MYSYERCPPTVPLRNLIFSLPCCLKSSSINPKVVSEFVDLKLIEAIRICTTFRCYRNKLSQIRHVEEEHLKIASSWDATDYQL